MNPLSLELTGAVLSTVVNQIVTFYKVFPMGDDHSLMKNVIKVFSYPLHLIRPRGRILPRIRGEDKHIIHFCQFMDGLNGSRHWLHLSKQTGNLVQSVFVFWTLCPVLVLGFFIYLIGDI